MPLIGARELREQTAQVLRQVQEEKTEYIVTHQGRPVALLLPLDTAMIESALLRAAKEGNEGWELYERLADSLRQAWPAHAETQGLMDDIRGES
jgi:prevent-host-death family protein